MLLHQDDRYLQPYLEAVIKEREEKEYWEKNYYQISIFCNIKNKNIPQSQVNSYSKYFNYYYHVEYVLKTCIIKRNIILDFFQEKQNELYLIAYT